MSRKRRRSIFLPIIVVLAILSAIFVASDHGVRKYAEFKVRKEVTSRLLIGEDKIRAQIHGWPVIFAVLDNKLEGLNLVAEDLQFKVESVPIHLSKVDLKAQGLENIRNPKQLVIDSGKATATINYSDFSSTMKLETSYFGDGRLKLSFPMDVLGANMDITIIGKPIIEKGSQIIRIESPEASMGGTKVPAKLFSTAVDFATEMLDLPSLEGISYDAIRVDEEGVHLDVGIHKLDVSTFQR